MRACLFMLALVLTAAPAASAFAQSSDTSIQESSDGPRHVVVRPRWRKIPNGDDMARFYPEDAMRRGLSVKVVMQCNVAREGTLYGCAIITETPPNAGFGAAALKLAPYFEMTPQMEDGRPVAGGVVRIPVVFNIDSPDPPSSREGRGRTSPLAALARWFMALIVGFVAFIQSIV